MSEVQNTEQGTSTPVEQIQKKFLDYNGLKTFWDLIKAKLGANLSLTIDNATGASIELKDVSNNTIKNINIPIANSETAGLITSEQAETLNNISDNLEGQVTLKGIGFGSVEDDTFQTAVISDIVIKKTDAEGIENNDTLEKYINLDLFVDKDSQTLCIIDRNSYKEVDSTDPETGEPIKIKEKTNNVLSKVNISDICAAGIIESADIIEVSTPILDPETQEETGDFKYTTYLQLTLKYTNGTTGTVDINVEDLIHQYLPGDGLELTNISGDDFNDNKYSGTFKIKIKNIPTSGEPGTENYVPGYQEKYLKVDRNGLYTTGIDDAINEAVKDCATQTDLSTKLDKLSNDITIVGGPFEDTLKQIYKDGIIPNDETFQGFLTKLALHIQDGTVKYASPSTTTAPITWSKGINHSAITFTHNSYNYTNSKNNSYDTNLTANANIECGEFITANVSMGSAFNNDRQCKLTASNGYFEMNPVQFNENGTPNFTNATWNDHNENTSLTLIGTGKSKNGQVGYKSIYWKGFEENEFMQTIDNTLTNTLNQNGEKTTLKLKEGENYLEIKTGGVTFKSGTIRNAIICASTNTKEIVKNPSTASNTLVYIYNDSEQTVTPETTTKYSIYGKRADWFVCSPTKVITLNKADLKPDTNNDGYLEYGWSGTDAINNIFRATEGVFKTGKKIGHTVPSNKTEKISIAKGTLQVVIAVRNKLKAIDSKAQNSPLIDSPNMLKFTMHIEGANGYATTNYYVYIYNYGQALGADSEEYTLTYA